MLDNNQLYDKILACWMGKNIGGTMGGPVEGRMEILSFTDLPEIGKEGPLPNDDLDLQLVNLHALEKYGTHIVTQNLSEEWAKHVYFPYDEYGYALMNIRRNIASPLSGFYNNPFINCMGSPIRSELWAAVNPGNPERAVHYAFLDAMVDHAGGEGLYGEMFFAAFESLAFESNDIAALTNKALSYLPEKSGVYKAVKDTLKWHCEGVLYSDIRNKILEKYGSTNFTDAPQNIAFTMVGLLYGSDFADGMIKTINLGYDTDCTCATFGSIYGIIHGTNGIPKSWSEKVGCDIKISKEIYGLDYPNTISELTERTIKIKAKLDDDQNNSFEINEDIDFNSQIFYIPEGFADYDNLIVTISAKDKCPVVPERDKEITVTFYNKGTDTWSFKAGIRESSTASPDKIITLKRGETAALDFVLKGNLYELLTAPFCLSVSRLHDEALWKKYDIHFVLPVASRWLIDEKEAYLEGGFVEFSAGKHCIKTTLDIPDNRNVKLICAATAELEVTLDNEAIIKTSGKEPYMPAFHRCPDSQYKNVFLTAGRHTVTVHTNSNASGKFMLLPVSTRKDNVNGCNYYFTDCLLGANI